MIRAFNHPFNVQRLTLANGCNLSYIDEGKGATTLLFIHGLATYGLSWRKNIEYLRQRYRCIAIDLPGNGFSDRGDYPYSINFFSVCVYDMMVKLKLSNVCLVGHSMGGQIAMRLLLQEPAAAQRLILCAPAGFEAFSSFEKSMYRPAMSMLDIFSTDENSLRESIRSSFYRFKAEGSEMITELLDLMQAYPSQQYRNMINACVHSMLEEPVHQRLHLIKQPTLVLFGENDALIPNRLIHPLSNTRQIAEEGTSRLHDAVLKIIPQCGHFLQIEKADIVNKHIANWLSD